MTDVPEPVMLQRAQWPLARIANDAKWSQDFQPGVRQVGLAGKLYPAPPDRHLAIRRTLALVILKILRLERF